LIFGPPGPKGKAASRRPVFENGIEHKIANES
jgi:hypothetical protein